MNLRELKSAYEYLNCDYEKFMISQNGFLVKDDKCLIIKFSNSNKWGFPGGRLDKMEMREAGLRRELKEEIGLENFKNLGVFDYEIFYTPHSKKAVCAIVNLIEVEDFQLKLSHEHSDYKWIKEDEVDKIDFLYPDIAKRFVKNVFKYKRLLEK